MAESGIVVSWVEITRARDREVRLPYAHVYPTKDYDQAQVLYAKVAQAGGWVNGNAHEVQIDMLPDAQSRLPKRSPDELRAGMATLRAALNQIGQAADDDL
jgi:hypothetical protein